jgi:hypothetical protein
VCRTPGQWLQILSERSGHRGLKVIVKLEARKLKSTEGFEEHGGWLFVLSKTSLELLPEVVTELQTVNLPFISAHK